MNTSPYRICLVEDDERIRAMLIVLLEGTSGLRCVGAYQDAESALADAPLKQPDLMLMDIQLPGMNGIDAVHELKKRLPDTECIMLTVYEDTQRIFQALEAGAIGYLLKSTSPAELIEGILEVRNGGSPMSPQIARKVVQSFKKKPVQQTEGESLTEREEEVLQLLSKGYTYKEIADQCFISRDTVHSHIRNIYRKLQVRSRTEAVVKYLSKMP